jgi:integrase
MTSPTKSTATTLPGVQAMRAANGRVYYYHRKTRTRLSDDPVKRAAEVAALNASAPPRPEVLSVRTLGGVIEAYKRSPEFAALSPDTVVCYQRAFDAVADWRGKSVAAFDAKSVLTLRDNLYADRGRWLANMTVAVLSVVFGWAIPRGLADTNPAAGVPKIRRPRGQGVANPGWSAAEVDAMLELATHGMRKGVALAYYTGMRLKDVVETRRDEWKGQRIERRSSKPGVPVVYYVVKRLAAILAEPDVKPGEYLVVTLAGRPFTRDGFKTNFIKLKDQLLADGKLAPGRTFHGLRKSLGKDAAELGFSENDIAGALGQTSPASARPYTVEAKQRLAAERVMRALERRGKR